VPFGREQVLFGRLGVIVCDGLGEGMSGVASQPGSAAGSRILSRCSTSLSQTVWAASWASAASSRCRRQMDQTSGAYRSISASQACRSPSVARVTRPVTTGSSRLWLACRVGAGFAAMAFS